MKVEATDIGALTLGLGLRGTSHVEGVVATLDGGDGGVLRVDVAEVNLVGFTLLDGHTFESVLTDPLTVHVVVWHVVGAQQRDCVVLVHSGL